MNAIRRPESSVVMLAGWLLQRLLAGGFKSYGYGLDAWLARLDSLDWNMEQGTKSQSPPGSRTQDAGTEAAALVAGSPACRAQRAAQQRMQRTVHAGSTVWVVPDSYSGRRGSAPARLSGSPSALGPSIPPILLTPGQHQGCGCSCFLASFLLPRPASCLPSILDPSPLTPQFSVLSPQCLHACMRTARDVAGPWAGTQNPGPRTQDPGPKV